MAYIGREPQIGNYQICDAISVVNGQAAYTMQVSSVNVIPESVNHMIVSLNGVIQKPGSSYTISSSTITFSSNLATGDSIDFIYLLGNTLDLGTPSDDTVTGAKIVDNAINSEHYTDGSIDTAHIADSNVTTAKLATDAVTTAKITDGNVTTAKIAADAITEAKIADNAISEEHLDVTAITGHTAETTVADGDLVVIHDASATALRKMTVANLTANAGVAGISSSADATAMTITDAEKIGIGETSPMALVHIKQADSGMSSVDTDVTQLVVEDDSTAGITILGGTSGKSTLFFGDGADNDVGHVEYDHASHYINFKVSGDDVMRLAHDREIFFTKTSESANATGSHWKPNGSQWQVLNAQGYNIINRDSDDGVFVYLKQANSTEGSISVSGTTVSYNTFTGTHWSRLADNSKPTILKGTVLETLDAMVDWYNLEFNDSDGNPQKISHLLTGSQSDGDVITYNHKGTDYQATIVKEVDIKHVQTKISTTSEAKNVYGVFHCWDFGDDDGVNDMQVASVGTYVVRIKSGETVTKGDLLQSNGDGTAKVQSDDNVKSSSFAKVLSNTKIETYDDGSFIVPCSLNC
jgi:hypothetical protein